MYPHPVEHHSAVTQRRLLIHAITQRNLQSIMVNEEPQTEKIAYCTAPFIGNPRKGKTVGTESGSAVARAWG